MQNVVKPFITGENGSGGNKKTAPNWSGFPFTPIKKSEVFLTSKLQTIGIFRNAVEESFLFGGRQVTRQ